MCDNARKGFSGNLINHKGGSGFPLAKPLADALRKLDKVLLCLKESSGIYCIKNKIGTLGTEGSFPAFGGIINVLSGKIVLSGTDYFPGK